MSISPISVQADGILFSSPGIQLQPIKPPVVEIPELGLTLADDFLPPASMNGLTDAQLKAEPKLWPFDNFRKHRTHPLNKNVPATVTTVKKETFTHNTTLLLYWADNLALAWFDAFHVRDLNTSQRAIFDKKWEWLTKGTEVITNHKSRENGYYDPILDVNRGAAPIGIDALHMEQNVFKPVDSFPRRYGTVTGFLFETLDGTMLEYDIRACNYRTHPWFWPRANIIMADEQRDSNGDLFPYLPNGRLGLDPFPQGWDGSLNAHTPVPCVSVAQAFGNYTMPAGRNLIPMNRVKLSEGALSLSRDVPNPYNPERNLN